MLVIIIYILIWNYFGSNSLLYLILEKILGVIFICVSTAKNLPYPETPTLTTILFINDTLIHYAPLFHCYHHFLFFYVLLLAIRSDFFHPRWISHLSARSSLSISVPTFHGPYLSKQLHSRTQSHLNIAEFGSGKHETRRVPASQFAWNAAGLPKGPLHVHFDVKRCHANIFDYSSKYHTRVLHLLPKI